MMKKFQGYVRTDKVGSQCEFEFEVEDGATDDEIEDAGREAMFECIEWNFEEAPE